MAIALYPGPKSSVRTGEITSTSSDGSSSSVYDDESSGIRTGEITSPSSVGSFDNLTEIEVFLTELKLLLELKLLFDYSFLTTNHIFHQNSVPTCSDPFKTRGGHCFAVQAARRCGESGSAGAGIATCEPGQGQTNTRAGATVGAVDGTIAGVQISRNRRAAARVAGAAASRGGVQPGLVPLAETQRLEIPKMIGGRKKKRGRRGHMPANLDVISKNSNENN